MDHRHSIISIGVEDDIFDATRRQDLPLLRKLLEQSCSPNQVDTVSISNIRSIYVI